MDKTLKSLNLYLSLKIKKIIIISSIFLCFSSIVFCLYKVIYALLNTHAMQANVKWSAKNYTKPYTPKTNFTKGMLFLTLDDFSPFSPQADLIEGEKYFILKALEHNEDSINCLYGFFQLTKKNSHQLNFKSLNHFNGKKFEQYSLVTSKKVKYRVLQNNQLPEHLFNCKNWLHIDNTMVFFNHNQDSVKQISMEFTKSKCTVVPSANLFSVHSENPNIAYFEYDHIANKLKLCIQKTGNLFVQYMTLNSTQYETQNLKIESRFYNYHVAGRNRLRK